MAMWNKTNPTKHPPHPLLAQPTEQTAIRPHRITIWIGAFSPFLGAVALVVSLFSLKTSRDSLKLGQRAYLAFSVTGFTVTEDPSAATPTAKAAVTIKNVGNTPAYIDDGQTMLNSQNIRTDKNSTKGGGSFFPVNLVLAPKDEIPAADADVTFASEIEASCPDEAHCYVIKFKGDVQWHDVFGDHHTDSWCKSLFRMSPTNIRIDNCTPAKPK
jgi:hypothetical protein